MSEIRVSAKQLLEVCTAAYERHGLSHDDAHLAADTLVQANLRGVDTHGVAMLPFYITRLRCGSLNPRPQMTVLRERAATVLANGDNGPGHVVAARAMQMALAKVPGAGIVMVAVRNSNHFGMAAYYAMMALEHGMIGIAMTNARAVMAPWGGVAAMLGNNPLAVALPAGDETPIVLDMAMTVNRLRIRAALARGESIPADWATDEHGQPTTDPAVALKGFLRPIGGPKGYGLALVIEVLAGILAGARRGPQIGSVIENPGQPQGVGHVFWAIDIEAFFSTAEFTANLATVIREIRACPRAPGVDRIYLPGEIEHECMLDRRAAGIPLSEDLWEEIRSLATGQ